MHYAIIYLKYAKIPEICIYMPQKLFPMYPLLNKLSTLFTPMNLHNFKQNMQMHKNPDTIDYNLQSNSNS